MSALRGFKALFKSKEAKIGVSSLASVEKEPQETHAENEAEIIEKIEDIYYGQDGGVCETELMRLSEFDSFLIDERLRHLSMQERAVSSCLVRIISDNHFAYVQEMDSVIGIQESLQDAHVTCCNARRCLDKARNGISEGTLGLLAKHRHKNRTECLFDTFKDLQQLRRLSAQFRNYLEGCLYPQVIQISVGSSQFLKDFSEFDCIRMEIEGPNRYTLGFLSDMAEKFQVGMNEAQLFIEKELGLMYKNFDSDSFLVLYKVLELTGTIQTAVRTVIEAFKSGVRQTSLAVVTEALQRNVDLRDYPPEGKHFPSLCKDLVPSQFSDTLRKLAKEFFIVMRNYFNLRSWFENLSSVDTSRQVGNSDQIEAKELKGSTTIIWQEIERHVKLYMEACDFTALKYDDVISALQTVQMLTIAELEFTGLRSEALQVSIRQLTLKYFMFYHRSKMESLHAMMQNEAWEAVPVEVDFSLSALAEIRNLQVQVRKNHDMCRVESSNLFVKYEAEGNPFDEDLYIKDMDGSDNLGVHCYSDAYVYSEEIQEKNGPIVSNPALTVMKLFGDYMQMMAVLEPIAFDVLQCMTHLFDFFLYSVFVFFSQSEQSGEDAVAQISGRLGGTLKRIKETLIIEDSDKSFIPSSSDEVKVPMPIVFTDLLLMLGNPDSLFGIRARIVAVESLAFLAVQFKTVAIPLLETLVPASKKAFLNQYVSQTLSTIDELRIPVYKVVVRALFDPQKMIFMMVQVKWDIHELLSQHNQYVDMLLQDIRQFKAALESERYNLIPAEAKHVIWTEGILRINHAFVEGFSQVKYCSNEGRALMQLDYQQFVTKLKVILEFHHIPGQDFVEQYIKAYYLSEHDIVKWIEDHKEYSQKQLTALVNSGLGSHIGKRAKQRLKSLLNFEEMSARR